MQEGSGPTANSTDAPAASWLQIAERHYGAMLAELAPAVEHQVSEAVITAVAEERRAGDERTAEARVQTREETQDRTRRNVSDGLNQALRLLRQVASQGGVLKLLAEASAPWAKSAAVLLVEEEQIRPLATRGLLGEDLSEPIPLDQAAALNAVIESTDPITAAATPSEVSEALCLAFGEEAKCHLFPVTVRGSVTAIFITSGDLVTGALELLSEAAGMRLEILQPAEPPAIKPLEAPGLIQIAAATKPQTVDGDTPKASAVPSRWEDLSPADQKLHLHAQRIARVRVAEFRLYHAEALRKGVFAGDIYGNLREQIDPAREEFLQNCMAKSATMVDYLHLEILRSLAHDDERLLGSQYPGPLA